MKMQAREIAGHLTKRAIAAELPWSIGQRELIVLRAQDHSTFVKESFVEREINGESQWVKQRDYSRVAISAADLVNSEAAFFERLSWHTAKFYGLRFASGANKPLQQNWTKEEKKEIGWVALHIRAGAEDWLWQVRPEILLAARHLNYILRKKAKTLKRREAQKSAKFAAVEALLALTAAPPRKIEVPMTIRVYENDNNPFSDLPL